ncbi:hypothetical protein [Streptomyces sp. NPDC088794]|uniref:hypothetical protein n=1 Tax=Streptomyces sp. NPDC088794 TaxID=3365902 RepID=UPI0037F6B41A
MNLTASCPVPPSAPAADEQPLITAEDARIVLQHYGHPASGPDRTSTFRGRVVALIAEADAANRLALYRSYPPLVAAVQLARTSPTGIDTLHAIAQTVR